MPGLCELIILKFSDLMQHTQRVVRTMNILMLTLIIKMARREMENLEANYSRDSQLDANGALRR
jgi:hypothetical protein